MDVIALAQAGFANAVAPLGTAVTEAQLALLWQLADEPVVCLDGDEAGLRAAHRLIERALPVLKPGKSLRFALLPAGQDPDSLLRSAGRGALERRLADALPLIEFLWRRELAGRSLSTPERRAALTQRWHAAGAERRRPRAPLAVPPGGPAAAAHGVRSPRAAGTRPGPDAARPGRRRRRVTAPGRAAGPARARRCAPAVRPDPGAPGAAAPRRGGVRRARIRRAGARRAAPGNSFLVRQVRPP